MQDAAEERAGAGDRELEGLGLSSVGFRWESLANRMPSLAGVLAHEQPAPCRSPPGKHVAQERFALPEVALPSSPSALPADLEER